MLNSTQSRTCASSGRITGHDNYIALCIELAKDKTAGYSSISEVRENLERINEYSTIDRLEETWLGTENRAQKGNRAIL